MFFVVASHLVQCHVWQAGSHVTGLLLWIRHRVAVESQQLLQRKLTGLHRQTVTERDRQLQRKTDSYRGRQTQFEESQLRGQNTSRVKERDAMWILLQSKTQNSSVKFVEFKQMS